MKTSTPSQPPIAAETLDRWISRRRLSPDDMVDWSVDDWTTWWSDGLDIWFSEAPLQDRERAFAPVRVLADRAELEEQLVDALRPFYPTRARYRQGVAQTRRLQEALEQGALNVMNRRGDMTSEARAVLIVGVFADFHARSLPQMVQAAISAVYENWFELEGPSELLSALSYAVFDDLSHKDLDALREPFEAALENEDNYATVLNYCLKAYDRIAVVLDTFMILWGCRQKEVTDEVWRDVAESLERKYNKRGVARALKEILDTEVLDSGAYAASVYLARFYDIEGGNGFRVLDQRVAADTPRGAAIRGLSILPNLQEETA